MYRIRRESGEEASFGSIDELGAAVASGVVTAKAEIFHARAEKWLPIASHPHFKMAHDRINSASTPKAPARAPGLGASGQRPAVTAPQASVTAPRPQAPQLRVMRPEASAAAPTATAAPTDAAKAAPRWNSAQRPAARAVAPKPSAPSAPPASDLRLVRADTLLSGAATAPALPEVEFELLPVESLAVVEPVSAEPAVAHMAEAVVPAPAAPESVAETVVERSPTAVELVSHEEQPAAVRGEVEIINPDRTMPVMSKRVVPSLEIPEPIRDFGPTDAVAAPVAAARSKAPLFIGIGLVTAVAAVIGFFVMQPSSPEPAPPRTATAPAPAPAPASAPAPTQQSTPPIAVEPTPTSPVVTSAPKGASTGLGGDVQVKTSKKSDGTETASAGSIGDGLEPPPEVLPAAPSLGRIGDAAALPTVDAGTIRNDAMARASALEKTRREIDSSMRR